MQQAKSIALGGVFGGMAGLLSWLVVYLTRRTPAIGLDGPAEFGAVSATLVGLLIGALSGAFAAARMGRRRRD